MLGLGLSLNKGGGKVTGSEPVEVRYDLITYSSDFTSDQDGWNTYVTNANNVLVNQTVGGVSGCLEIRWFNVETSPWYFRKDFSSFSPNLLDQEGTGSEFTISFDVYFKENIANNIYTPVSGLNGFVAGLGVVQGNTITFDTEDMAADTWHTVSGTATINNAGNNYVYIGDQTSPGSGDSIFFKNIEISYQDRS